MSLRPNLALFTALGVLVLATPLRAEPASGKGGAMVQSFGDVVETADGPSGQKPDDKSKTKTKADKAADVAAAADGVDAPKPRPRPRRRPKPRPKPAAPPAAANGLAPNAAAPPPPVLSPGAASVAQISAPTQGPARPFTAAEAAATLAPLYAGLTDFLPLEAENTLILDTEKGRIVVALRPEFAPEAVARIKKLSRRKVYDGLLFHRVIEDFVAQSGNPNNRDGGKSDEPNLAPEFTFRLGADIPRAIVARPQGESEGFIGASPYVSVDEMRMASSPDHRITAWGAYCAGVMGMGRDAAPDSANSEFFFMRAATRRLDRDYTVIGKVVAGMEVVRALTVGEPPVHPDRIIRASVMADLPDAERPRLKVLNTLSPQFAQIVDKIRALRGADFSVCDIEVPTRAY